MRKNEKKRSEQVILYNRRTIARQYLKGRNQEDIAEMVNLTQATVSKEIDALKEQWVRSTEVDFAEAQGAALNKVDAMEQEALNQYKKSKRAKKTTTQKKQPAAMPDNENPEVTSEGEIVAPIITEYVIVEETIRKEEGTGDVKWYDQVMKCIDMRLKILGLYNQSSKEPSIGPFIPTGIAKETTKSKVALFLAVFKEWDDAS